MKVRVRSGKHYRSEAGQTMRYGEGDIFDATEAELLGFRDRFEIIEVETPEDAATIDPGDATTPESSNPPEKLLTEAPGGDLRQAVGDELAAALEKADITSLEELAEIAGDPDALAKVKGIGKAKAKRIREALMSAKEP